MKNKNLVYIILGSVIMVGIVVLIINVIIKSHEEITVLPTDLLPEKEMIPEMKQREIMQWNSPPEMVVDKEANYIAILKTNKGDIEIELFVRENPITVNNFVFLAQQGFYSDIIFHRVINGFMVQAGCPLGKGTGGPGYTIPDEFRLENRNNRGTISMANAGPNTGGSQFFINLVDNNFLDARHPAFGKVIKGMEVIDAISLIKTDRRDFPLEKIVIKTIEIVKQ